MHDRPYQPASDSFPPSKASQEEQDQLARDAATEAEEKAAAGSIIGPNGRLPLILLEWPPCELDDEEPIALAPEQPAMKFASIAMEKTQAYHFESALMLWQTVYSLAVNEASEMAALAAQSYSNREDYQSIAGAYNQLADLADYAITHLDEPAGQDWETFA
jgi:hypothetical protein